MCFYPSFFTKTLLTPFMFLKWFRCIYVEGWFTRTTGISIKVRVNRDDASIKHKHISTFVLTSSWFTRTFSCTYAYVVRVNQPLPWKDINIQLFSCRSHFLFRDFRPISSLSFCPNYFVQFSASLFTRATESTGLNDNFFTIIKKIHKPFIHLRTNFVPALHQATASQRPAALAHVAARDSRLNIRRKSIK